MIPLPLCFLDGVWSSVCKKLLQTCDQVCFTGINTFRFCPVDKLTVIYCVFEFRSEICISENSFLEFIFDIDYGEIRKDIFFPPAYSSSN